MVKFLKLKFKKWKKALFLLILIKFINFFFIVLMIIGDQWRYIFEIIKIKSL